MSDHRLSIIEPGDKRAMDQLDALLQQEGIQRDANLDLMLGLYDEDYQLVATGSCYHNTLRCMAVDSAHQGEGLLNAIISELIGIQYQRGNTELFLYTKCDKASTFQSLGFYEVARVPGRVVFMENQRGGFEHYLKHLRQETTAVAEKILQVPDREAMMEGAVVINANPFTLGHQYLLETAAKACDRLHVFMVSEDVSLIPFAVRERLIRQGSAHLQNLVYHRTGPYLISNATFPSYFLKDQDIITASHAELDTAVFLRIAMGLGIRRRFVGEEPFSHTTAIYNRIMQTELTAAGLDCVIVPRKDMDGQAISASQVRNYLKCGDFAALQHWVPDTTLAYFQSPEAEPILQRIRSCEHVMHH